MATLVLDGRAPRPGKDREAAFRPFAARGVDATPLRAIAEAAIERFRTTLDEIPTDQPPDALPRSSAPRSLA